MVDGLRRDIEEAVCRSDGGSGREDRSGGRVAGLRRWLLRSGGRGNGRKRRRWAAAGGGG